MLLGQHTTTKVRRFHILVCILAALSVGSGANSAPNLTITGPIEGKPILDLGEFDIKALGYVTEEFFVSGTAASYTSLNSPGNGQWTVEPAESASFATRVVVVRPSDTAKFNGSVVVEWLNVTGGGDLAVDWKVAHRELIREGFAYVGVSAQKIGVEGTLNALPGAAALKRADPERYGTLVHPGDKFAFDIYTQAGRAVRGGDGASRLLGPLTPQRVLSIGDSQSAAFLTTYVNAIDSRDKVFDGFLIHSRSGGSAPIEGRRAARDGGAPAAIRGAVKIRTDVRVPVIVLITETDLVGRGASGFFGARQPDNDNLRVWEIAGTAHADVYFSKVGYVDSGLLPIDKLADAFRSADVAFGQQMSLPMNVAPQHHYVLEAAVRRLDLWIRDGQPPPKAAPIAALPGAKPGDSPSLMLDKNGNALGGVRTPWVDVPTAKLSGLGQSGEGFAFLFGTTAVFDASTLAQLYPGGRAEYLAKFKQSLDETVSAGFLLKDDVAEIMDLAAAMYPDE